MEWIEPFETNLVTVVTVLKLMLEWIAVICVATGVLATSRLAIEMLTRRGDPRFFVALRLRFGTWLALALEFQLGADILATTVAPSFDAVVKLAAIAAIRTFLNYVLRKEIEAEESIVQAPT